TERKPCLAALIEATNIPASLVRAVVRQMGGWETFTQSAPDICRGGIDGGFNGFIYYRDTEAFAKRNRADILTLAKDQASDLGESVLDMVAGFGCLGGSTIRNRMSGHATWISDSQKDYERRKILSQYHEAVGAALFAGKNLQDGENVLNALAWYAGEEVARAYCDLCEMEV